MVDFTYDITLECDLAGSQWIGWKWFSVWSLWTIEGVEWGCMVLEPEYLRLCVYVWVCVW